MIDISRRIWRKRMISKRKAAGKRILCTFLAALLLLTACGGNSRPSGDGAGGAGAAAASEMTSVDVAKEVEPAEASGVVSMEAAASTNNAASTDTAAITGNAASADNAAITDNAGSADSAALTAVGASGGDAGLTSEEAFAASNTDPADGTDQADETVSAADASALTAEADRILSQMSPEEKIAQMIIPAIRTWDGQNVTDLDQVSDLAGALRRHQYGGIILFGGNITGSGQTANLVAALQENNAQNEDVSTSIPYFMAVDEEGGNVTRFSTGTRMTGSMAIGATGENAKDNAMTTGLIIGEEMAALGFNVDFAPVVDVNNNPSNPVIGTRSFSDDPELVAELGEAFSQGLARNHIIATYKHFPGHGDTGIDSHIGTPSVDKTYEEIRETELVPFAAAIRNGAEMIMTAHITYPAIDEEQTFADGVTKGFYPATMSGKMITEILRGDMGYDGLVVTDALEMDAIDEAGLVPGAQGSLEYRVNVAEKVINAGVDLLLIPTDLNSRERADFYDRYIAALAEMAEDGRIPQARIDESVERILRLKLKYGILEPVLPSLESVGSDAHHLREMEIARQAVTVVKNDAQTLPAAAAGKKIVLLGRQESDITALNYYVKLLREEGALDADARITIETYLDTSGGEPVLRYTDGMRQAIQDADLVVGMTRTYSLDALAAGAPQYEGIHRAIEDTHAGGGRFVLLSQNLPYDAARWQEADAIVLAYNGSGLMDPTDGGTAGRQLAGNANVPAALETIFGFNAPSGTLPVNIPVIEEGADGTLSYGIDLLYERGYGLFFE